MSPGVSKKPPVILLPGLMCDAALWDFVAPTLAEVADIQHGNLFDDDTIAGMAARVLDDAPETFAIVGFSMGGYIAREIAMTAPDRVTKLALMNTSALGTTDKIRQRNARVLKILRDRPFTGLSPISIREALHPDRQGDTGLIDHIQTMARRLGGDVFRRQMSLIREDGHARLREITCPTLVVTSDADVLRRAIDSERLADGIADARLEIIENCGHMTPLERPEEVAGLLVEWLTVDP